MIYLDHGATAFPKAPGVAAAFSTEQNRQLHFLRAGIEPAT